MPRSFISIGATALISLCIWGCATGRRAADATPDAEAIMERVQSKYREARAYHFVHRIALDQVDPSGTESRLAAFNLSTATAGVTSRERSQLPFPLTLEQVRLEAWKDGHRTLLVSSRQGGAVYSAKEGHLKRGKSARDVIGSVPGSMLTGLHLAPLIMLSSELSNPVLVRKEMVLRGETSRPAYVVTGELPAGEAPGCIGLGEYASMVMLQGFSEMPDFAAWQADGTGTVTLWIDEQEMVVLRSVVSQPVVKLTENAADRNSLEKKRVVLKMADHFETAKIGRVEEPVFVAEP